MTEEKKVKYKDLSTSLKVLVVLTWILLGFYGLMFLLGVAVGFLTSY